MSEFEAILNQAKTLGEAISAHDRVKKFAAAQAAVGKDANAQKLLADYQQHVEHVHKLESEGKPIEVGDKHKLRELQTAMAGNDTLKLLMRSQADYLELMNRVHEAMEAAMVVDARA